MKYLYFVICSILALPSRAQMQDSFPQHYFRNPLRIPIALAGGFGECRPNHFHTGIDIKTRQRENLPVYAAADGYIARISISSTGYGNALYINHPNGYTTVYGHLNDFYPGLQQWMIDQQYSREKWAVELYPEPGQFPVKKGQLIAYSGTTGGSTGPHVHFEIRNTQTGHVLNELLFGLPFWDTRPPVPKSIALYNAGKSIYGQEPSFFRVTPSASGYTVTPGQIDSLPGEIYVGIQAQDYTDNSPNWLGIYRMKLYLDDRLQAETLLSELDFGQSRYVNAYADYKTKEQKGVWYQGLYRLPNNRLAVYPFLNNRDGALDIRDGVAHAVRIELYDAGGNKSEVHFRVKYAPASAVDAGTCAEGLGWSCHIRNVLSTGTLYFEAGDDAFYDDLCFHYSEAPPSGASLTNKVQLYDAAVPIQSPCTLKLKLKTELPENLRTKIAFVHHVLPASLPGNNPQNGMAALYEKGWAAAPVTTFGNYYAVVDTVAPVIVPLQKGTDFSDAKHIRFRVTDETTSVSGFRGMLNGKWLRFVQRGDTYTYSFDRHCPKGVNTLVISAQDENRNSREYTLQFTR